MDISDLQEAVKRHGGNVTATARTLGIAESTLRGRLRAVPMSEDQSKAQYDWTAEDCIAELRRIASIDETKVITRNYFRVNSKISESVWNRFYGTFEEFKRQAGITLSRHVHRLERDIAKHASKDKQRAMNGDKRAWEGKYSRPSNRRFQSVLVCSDIHDKHCDPFYRRLFIETARRVQPEKIVFNGDILDLTEFGKYTQDPRTFDLVGRLKWVGEFFKELRKACPDAEFIYVEGNHEFRLIRHLAEATPAMMVLLSDLHGMTVPDLFKLQEYEINYVARMDLAAFNEADIKKELAKNYVILHDALLFHHFPDGRNMGYPGANGHHHKHVVWNHYSPQFGPYEWHQLGAGHIRQASYCAGEKWSNGFMLCHVDTHMKRTQFEYIDCSHGHAIIGGRFYERQDNELLAA